MSAVAIDPLEVVPPELYIAWTDSIQYVLFFINLSNSLFIDDMFKSFVVLDEILNLE